MAEPTCSEKRRLTAAAHRTLDALAELLARQRDAIATECENTIRAIDLEIERYVAEKERSFGALEQHRKEHGC